MNPLTSSPPLKRIAIAIAVFLLALIAVPRAVQAEPEADSTSVVDDTFSGTMSERLYSIPAGVNAIDVVAVGGNGGDKGSIQGGRPAQVTGWLGVDPESAIYLNIGGDGGSIAGNPAAGGANGGGQGGYIPGAAYGAGGGGATDIRTVPGFEDGTLASRVIVAGGGGGAGSTANGTGAKAGAVGGNAGAAGARAESGGPDNTVGSGGFGGGAGTAVAGGGGGDAGFPYGGSSFGEAGHDGQNGSEGQGGAGGPGPDNAPPGGGGGGGGGVFGGGGGGGGGMMTGGPQAISTGGGGGGGGSSLGPAGSAIVTASNPAIPSINIQYTIPGTDISSGPATVTRETSAQFAFDSTEAGSTFECRIAAEDEFEPCASPADLSDLGDGAHTFEVRSTNEMGNFDPTPAEWSFTVDTASPTATIDSGPSGKTSDKRPVFTFSSSEAGSTFECRFDAAAFGACTGVTSDRPVADLPVGAHKFEVRATDEAGNVGEPAARDFEVEVASGGGGGGGGGAKPATIKLGKPKLNKKKGTATIKATVNQAGKVSLLKSKMVKSQTRTAEGAATVSLTIRAKGKALKRLKRKGRVTVTAKVSFAAKGSIASAKRKLTLKLKQKRK